MIVWDLLSDSQMIFLSDTVISEHHQQIDHGGPISWNPLYTS